MRTIDTWAEPLIPRDPPWTDPPHPRSMTPSSPRSDPMGPLFLLFLLLEVLLIHG